MPFSVFQVVVLAVFGALAVAGILIFAFVVGGASNQTIGEVEVWGTFDDVAINTVLRQLTEEDKRFQQILYVEKRPDTYAQELTDALAAGKGPDVFIIRHDEVYRDVGRLIPFSYESLPREQFQSTFVEAALPFLTPEGVAAVPLVVDPLVLYWNRDMLGTAGFAQPPESWSQLYEMAVKITKRDQSNTIERATIALGEYQNVSHAKSILSLLILQAGGAVTAMSGDALVPALSPRSGDNQQAAESALRFYTEFANPGNAYYTWNRAQKDSRAAFAAGELALYLGFASEEPLVRQSNPNLNFAVAPVPQIKSKEFKLDFANAYALAIPRTSDNEAGARTAVYLLAGSSTAHVLPRALGIPSARRDVLSERATGVDDLFNKQAIISKVWIDPHPQRTDELFRAMIESVTSGSSKLTEAIQRGEETLATLLREP